MDTYRSWWLADVPGQTHIGGRACCSCCHLTLYSPAISVLNNWRLRLERSLGLLAFTAIMIDGSIQGFVERNREGLLMGSMLVGDLGLEKLLRLEKLVLGENTLQAMYMLGGSVFLAMWLTRLKLAKLAQAGSLLAAILVVLATLAVFHYIPLHSIPAEHRALLLFSVPAGVALAGLSMLRFKDVSQIGWSQLVLCLTILAFPYAYAFGTGNNYWIPIGAAGTFVVLASLTILGPLARQPKLGTHAPGSRIVAANVGGYLGQRRVRLTLQATAAPAPERYCNGGGPSWLETDPLRSSRQLSFLGHSTWQARMAFNEARRRSTSVAIRPVSFTHWGPTALGSPGHWGAIPEQPRS